MRNTAPVTDNIYVVSGNKDVAYHHRTIFYMLGTKVDDKCYQETQFERDEGFNGFSYPRKYELFCITVYEYIAII